MNLNEDTFLNARESRRLPKAGEYLRFKLDQQVYAVDILSVQEIRTVEPVTKIVGSSANMLGVINLRGQIVPVFDIKAQLNMGSWKKSHESTYIVLNIDQKFVAIVVDAVMDVCNIKNEQIKPLQNMVPNEALIEAIGSLDDGMLMIIDVKQL